MFSENSYLFNWKPDYITKNETYWDSKKNMFACSRGSTFKEENK